jgi:hypothetical protein
MRWSVDATGSAPSAPGIAIAVGPILLGIAAIIKARRGSGERSAVGKARTSNGRLEDRSRSHRARARGVGRERPTARPCCLVTTFSLESASLVVGVLLELPSRCRLLNAAAPECDDSGKMALATVRYVPMALIQSAQTADLRWGRVATGCRLVRCRRLCRGRVRYRSVPLRSKDPSPARDS